MKHVQTALLATATAIAMTATPAAAKAELTLISVGATVQPDQCRQNVEPVARRDKSSSVLYSSVASNPLNRDELTAVWVEDFNYGLDDWRPAVARSTDAGRHWGAPQALPDPVAACAVGIADVHALYDAAGVAHISGRDMSHNTGAAWVWREDHPGSWSVHPILGVRTDDANVIADPDEPGTLYAAYYKSLGPIEVTRSVDGGVFWDPPVVVDPKTSVNARPTVFAATASGTLVLAHSGCTECAKWDPDYDKYPVYVYETDGSWNEWGPGVDIGADAGRLELVDPRSNTAISPPNTNRWWIQGTAVGDEVYLAWQRNDNEVIKDPTCPPGPAYWTWCRIYKPGSGSIQMVHRDAQGHWSPQRTVATSNGQAFIPTMGPSDDGGACLTYYAYDAPESQSYHVYGLRAHAGHTTDARPLTATLDSSAYNRFGPYEGVAAQRHGCYATIVVTAPLAGGAVKSAIAGVGL